ncbi:hypothetical protein LTR35_004510 [Friedmanniomyces endolithicus]|nr:hypothetical protein LTR35_004510 [Friedmanniomyces endolithicus]
MTLKKLDHGFKNDALSYDASPNYQPCIKLSFFFNKKPEVSDEQFHRHWETVHADLTIAARDFKACKVQRYVQFHQTADMKEKAKQLGLEHVAFDGCSEIWVRDWDDWMAFYSVMVGYDNLIFEHAIPGEGGKDGITAETLQSK